MSQKSVIIESNGIIQQLFLKENLEKETLQEILSVVYKIQSKQIVALVDEGNNVYDLKCFCQNLSNFQNNKKFTLLLNFSSNYSEPQNQQQPQQYQLQQDPSELNNHTFSKDRGQSQLGKRQKIKNNNSTTNSIQVQQNQFSSQNGKLQNSCYKNMQIEVDEDNRSMNRSQSIMRILPEKVQYFEDFEFFVKTTQHENPNTFYLIWFFDLYDKMKEYNFMSNTYLFNNLPKIEHYTGLYPSFRSRPFGKYDDTFCLSFFKGDQLLFERDIQFHSQVPKSIVYLIEENMEHPRPIHTSTPRNWVKNRSNSQHSQNIPNTPSHNNDYTFEAIEIFSQNSIRQRFNDQEFKEILKMVRKHNKIILSAYEAFKIDHDENELFETVKKILQSGESNLDVSFDKEDSSNFIPLKNQAQSVNMFTNTLINTENNSTSPSYQAVQNIQQNSEYLEDINNYNSFPIFFMKQYFREQEINTKYTYEEKAFILLGIKQNNSEVQEYIKGLIKDRVLKENVGITVIKRLANDLARQTYFNIFPTQVIEEINNKKSDKFSFVQGALCHLITHGNLDKFKEIILENTDDPIISPIPKNKDHIKENQYFINVQKDFNPDSSPTLDNNIVVRQQVQQSSYQQQSDQIPFPSIVNSQSSQPSKQPQQQQQQQQQVHSLFGNRKQNSPTYNSGSQQQPIHQQISNLSDISYGTNMTQNQITLFNASQSPRDIDKLLLIKNNLASRGSNSFDSTSLQPRKTSHKSSSRFDSSNPDLLPIYSNIAREKRRERKPTFQLINKNEQFQDNSNQVNQQQHEHKQQQSLKRRKLLDQQTNLFVDQYSQNLQLEQNFDRKYQTSFEQICAFLNNEQKNIVKKMYNATLPSIIEFFDNMIQDQSYLQNQQIQLANIIERHKYYVEDQEFEQITLPEFEQLSVSEQNRYNKYVKFREVLQYLYYIDHYISLDQYKFFHYLYIIENISTLGAFEVFMLNQDISALVEHLSRIMQYYFFKKEFTLEELEDFDETVEYQFGVFFIYKKELSTSQKLAILKTIKLGDITLFELYKEYNQNQNREQFLLKIKRFSDQRIQEFKDYEQQNQKSNNDEDIDEVIEQNKFQIQNYYNNKFLKQVGRIQVLLDFVQKQDPRINGIFELFEFNKDKSEFVENLTILYKQAFKKELVQTIEENKIIDKYTIQQREKFYEQIQEAQSVIFGAFEFYLDNKDLDEFKDSIERIIETL